MRDVLHALILAESEPGANYVNERLGSSGLRVISQRADSQEACSRLLSNGEWDIVACDARQLPLPTAVEELLHPSYTHPILFFSEELNPSISSEALRFGACVHPPGQDPTAFKATLERFMLASRKREAFAKREAFDAGQRAVLESISVGAPLAKILQQIVLLIEGQEEGLICSILLLDSSRTHVLHGAAPHLPEAYSHAIHGRAIGPNEGSCGAAAYRAERVIVSDIATHPNWTKYKSLALPFGLRSCWSCPIFSPSREVLGTFAIYYREVHVPTSREYKWVDVATHLASVAILRDRNELIIKRKEDALLRSEAEFRAVFEGAAMGIALLDKTTRPFRCNPALERLLGSTSEELSQTTLLELTFADDKDLGRVLKEELESGGREVFQMELRFYRKGSGIVWVRLTISFPSEEAESALNCIAMFEDISESKRLESEIHSEERLRAAAFEHISDLICYFSVEPGDHFRLLSANPATFRVTGLSEANVIGKRLEEIITGSFQQRYLDNFKQAVRERKIVRWDDELWRFPLGKKYAEVIITPVCDASGFCKNLAVTVHDLTERKKAQEQIAAQAALLDGANEAIILRGVDGIIHYWNQGATRLYEWTPSEVIGKSISELIYRETVPFDLAQSTLFADGNWSGEHCHYTKTGKKLFVQASWTLQRDDLGQPSYVLSINSDITEKKRLQAQIILAQRMESLGTLAGGIAHDFNNILTAILGNVGLLLKNKMFDAWAQEKLQVVQAAGERAADLVGQILAFSRHHETRRAVVKLKPSVEEAAKLLRATLPAMIDIKLDLSLSDLEVEADPSQIHQVVMNLGTNAAHAIGNRAGTIQIGLSPMQLANEVRGVGTSVRPGHYMHLKVTDTGTGMDELILARIFDPFFTTKPPGQGTGLGLSVVHGIVKSHLGAITVSSRIGRGTTFDVYLPIVTEEAKQDSTGKSMEAEVAHGNGEQILYVDDDEAIVVLVTQRLEGMGFRATGFTDPLRAIEAFAAAPRNFSAVVTDFYMAGMSGLELSKRILQMGAQVPIIMVSGYLGEVEMEELKRLGICAVLPKPGFVDDLVPTLNKVLSKI